MRNDNPFSLAAIAAGLIVTVVGGIIVTILAGEGRFGTVIPTVSAVQTDTSAAPTASIVILTPMPPKLITVTNQLLLPIRVYLDEVDRGQIDDMTTKTYLLDSFPVKLRWELVRTSNANGEPWGEMMGATYSPFNEGTTIEVTNIIADTFYFFPLLSNDTDQACEISINDGYSNERRLGYLPAHTRNVTAGYYTWLYNSNVTLYCPDNTYWWGIRPGSPDKSLNDFVEPKSGRIALGISP